MKKIILAIIMLLGGYFVMFPPQSSATAIKSLATNQYLYLTVDQVIPGGLTPTMITQLESQGYVHRVLSSDFLTKVQFKDGNGSLYWREGWLKSGLDVMIKDNVSGGEYPLLIFGCGNAGEQAPADTDPPR